MGLWHLRTDRRRRDAMSLGDDPNVELHEFEGAHHGFDIASLTTPRTVSLIPLLGPHATFAGAPAAAAVARARLREFLAAKVR